MKVSDILREDGVEDVTIGLQKLVGQATSGWKAGKDEIENRKAAIRKLDDKQLPAVKQLTKQFLTNFFDGFPNKPAATDLKKVITTRKTGKAVFAIMKEVASDIEKMQKGINNAAVKIVPGGKATVDGLADIASGKGKPSPELANFVKKEIDFFKRMVTLDNDLQVDLPHAASQLNAKMIKTQEGRRTDAVMALNWIFFWLHKCVLDYAEEIAQHTAKLPQDSVQ